MGKGLRLRLPYAYRASRVRKCSVFRSAVLSFRSSCGRHGRLRWKMNLRRFAQCPPYLHYADVSTMRKKETEEKQNYGYC